MRKPTPTDIANADQNIASMDEFLDQIECEVLAGDMSDILRLTTMSAALLTTARVISLQTGASVDEILSILVIRALVRAARKTS